MPRGQKKRFWNSGGNQSRRHFNESRDNLERPRPPPGLKGREIGMFYKNLNKNKKRDFAINFSIPKSVVKRVRALIQDISNTNEGKFLKKNFMQRYGNNSIFDYIETVQGVSADNKRKCDFKKPAPAPLSEVIDLDLNEGAESLYNPSKKEVEFITIEDEQDVAGSSNIQAIAVKASSSNAPQFIEDEDDKSNDTNMHQFKFSYNDIISGTFEEKLDECLSQNVKPSLDLRNLNEAFYCQYEEMIRTNKYNRILEFREVLPAYKKSKELLEIIENHQVVVISGETGCGKSTQVPQIILDDAILNRKGANTRIVVTQPRRIAASSLAKRVAEERAESMGHSVGYMVRLEKVEPRPDCNITFCTTGILLSELETNQGLTNKSHIILDEVHERDSNVDITMCMLRQIINKRKDLKIILMSATLDAESLSKYFDGCPLFHIEGLAYPVTDIFLEDILHMTNFTLEEERSKRNVHYMQRRRQALEMQRDIEYKAEVGPWLDTIKHKISRQVYRTLLNHKVETLNMELIVCLLIHICKGAPGAILVFVPGIGDITKLLKEMDYSKAFPRSSYAIYPLHSKLPSLDQHRIFDRPPPEVRKIIVATNIAETSLTIDDVVYVVDCAKVKMKGLIVEDNLSTLKVEWISKANLRQRRGRAGRCQPGICYHLLTTFRANNIQERMLPEVQRSDLLESVLTIKKLRLGKAADALTMVPDPPAISTIESAVSHLKQCGALDDSEVLTPLGWHLARVPAHPAAGKLLILGALFGCLDRAASVAAVWGFKDPFLLVIGKEEEVDKVKRFFSLGEPSDHVAVSEAILAWEGAGRNQRSFAYENFLSNNTLELLVEMKRQFGDNLKHMGFLPTGNIKSIWENRNNKNISLFKAVVAASLYPNIASVRWIGLHRHHKPPKLTVQLPEGRVNMHPSSVLGQPPGKRNQQRALCENPGANWAAYWLKQKSSDIFLIDVTLVYTIPLLFFGELNINDVENSPNECDISISSFKVRCQKETACLLLELRYLLDHVLATKINASSEHNVGISPFEQSVLDAVIEVITAEDEQTEYISDDEDNASGSDTSDRDVPRRYYK